MFKKKCLIFIKTIFSLMVSTALLSCSDIASVPEIENSSETQSGASLSVRGGFSLPQGAVPQEYILASQNAEQNASALRAAFPSKKDLNFSVEAVSSGGATVTGSVDEETQTFTLTGLTDGTWTINLYGKKTVSGSEQTILKGSKSVTISAASRTVLVELVLEYTDKTSGTGDVDLQISIGAATSINLIECTGLGGTATDTLTIAGTTATLSKTGVTPGSYDVTFNFYNNSSGSKILLYSCRQTINVFGGATTNTWQGTAPYLTAGTDGSTFSVGPAELATFARSVFYVQGSGGSYTPSYTASDSNPGIYFAPFESLSAAAAAVNAAAKAGTSASGEYTVYVDGTISCGTDPGVSQGYAFGGFFPLTGGSPYKLTIKSVSSSKPAVIDANSKGRVLYFNNIEAEIDGVTLSGGKIVNSVYGMGGGVYLEGNSKLTLSNGTKITGNTACRGGGVYVTNSASLTVGEGCSVASNNAVFDIVGTSFGEGGGIYNTGTLTIDGGTVKGNTAASKGSGIYIPASKGLTLSGTLNITDTIYLESKSHTLSIDEISLEDENSPIPIELGEITATTSPTAFTPGDMIFTSTETVTEDMCKLFKIENDGSYSIAPDGTTGVLSVISASGSISIYTPDGKLTLSATPDSVTSSALSVTISAEGTLEDGSTVSETDTTYFSDWDMKLYYEFDYRRSGSTLTPIRSSTDPSTGFTFAEGWPAGDYIIIVKVKFNGTVYSSELEVTKE